MRKDVIRTFFLVPRFEVRCEYFLCAIRVFSESEYIDWIWVYFWCVIRVLFPLGLRIVCFSSCFLAVAGLWTTVVAVISAVAPVASGEACNMF